MLLEPNDTAATLEKIESFSQIPGANTIVVALTTTVCEFAAPCSVEKEVNSPSYGSSFGEGNVIARGKVDPRASSAALVVRDNLEAIGTDVETAAAVSDPVANDATATTTENEEHKAAIKAENQHFAAVGMGKINLATALMEGLDAAAEQAAIPAMKTSEIRDISATI
ncbi:hypothetical protein ACH5RR_021327 [Cinchona calisaya]|uniref:Uncharacterized protein n=1 Tax=Cinchona calisaya TaxID=153742 RepID=A0ABD2ZI82_9GENT